MDKALLPAGLHDLLFPDAQKKALITSRMVNYLHKFGYQLVEPPCIEFENSLFTGAGKELKNKTFRLMDPLSHRMMGVRSDITTQVARIAITRLKKSPLPLRLAYGGDVFRIKGEGLYAERQLSQCGIELIGVDNETADAEILLVIVAALKNLGLQGICVDFTMPRLVDIILDEMQYKGAKRLALLEVINQKNIAEIARLSGDSASLLVQISKAGLTIDDLRKITLPKAASNICNRLIAVIEKIITSDEDIKISIDPLESAKFAYHTGIGFTIFASNAKSEIGRGGRYEINDEEQVVAACGVTIYINEILRVLPIKLDGSKVFVPFGTSWQEVKQIIADDTKIVVCGAEEVVDIKSEAVRQACEYVFVDGKPQSL